mgnify:CR=1 FL=1
MVLLDSGVLVELTYGADGKPVAFCRGKLRDRDHDKAALLAWLRALAAQVRGTVEVP